MPDIAKIEVNAPTKDCSTTSIKQLRKNHPSQSAAISVVSAAISVVLRPDCASISSGTQMCFGLFPLLWCDSDDFTV